MDIKQAKMLYDKNKDITFRKYSVKHSLLISISILAPVSASVCVDKKINQSRASTQELMRFLSRARTLIVAFHIQVHAAYLRKQQHQERQTPPTNHQAIKDKDCQGRLVLVELPVELKNRVEVSMFLPRKETCIE